MKNTKRLKSTEFNLLVISLISNLLVSLVGLPTNALSIGRNFRNTFNIKTAIPGLFMHDAEKCPKVSADRPMVKLPMPRFKERLSLALLGRPPISFRGAKLKIEVLPRDFMNVVGAISDDIHCAGYTYTVPVAPNGSYDLHLLPDISFLCPVHGDKEIALQITATVDDVEYKNRVLRRYSCDEKTIVEPSTRTKSERQDCPAGIDYFECSSIDRAVRSTADDFLAVGEWLKSLKIYLAGPQSLTPTMLPTVDSPGANGINFLLAEGVCPISLGPERIRIELPEIHGHLVDRREGRIGLNLTTKTIDAFGNSAQLDEYGCEGSHRLPKQKLKNGNFKFALPTLETTCPSGMYQDIEFEIRVVTNDSLGHKSTTVRYSCDSGELLQLGVSGSPSSFKEMLNMFFNEIEIQNPEMNVKTALPRHSTTEANIDAGLSQKGSNVVLKLNSMVGSVLSPEQLGAQGLIFTFVPESSDLTGTNDCTRNSTAKALIASDGSFNFPKMTLIIACAPNTTRKFALHVELDKGAEPQSAGSKKLVFRLKYDAPTKRVIDLEAPDAGGLARLQNKLKALNNGDFL